jgi:hypothetical protein
MNPDEQPATRRPARNALRQALVPTAAADFEPEQRDPRSARCSPENIFPLAARKLEHQISTYLIE